MGARAGGAGERGEKSEESARGVRTCYGGCGVAAGGKRRDTVPTVRDAAHTAAVLAHSGRGALRGREGRAYAGSSSSTIPNVIAILAAGGEQEAEGADAKRSGVEKEDRRALGEVDASSERATRGASFEPASHSPCVNFSKCSSVFFSLTHDFFLTQLKHFISARVGAGLR